MIEDKDICFVTTTLYTKWLKYQSDIIKYNFPNSQHIIIDGRNNWPNSWFYWIEEVKKSNSKYFVHIDEDFFITNKEEFLKVIEKMETDDLDLIGCPDGLNSYRGANPVAINTFLMFGRIEKIRNINLNNIQFAYTNEGWINNYGIKFKEIYKNDFKYTFKETGGSNFKFEQEPYYAFLWTMKENGCKFDYLYPNFDDRFKSTNPRLTEESNDIGIHMWYTRQWNSDMDVWGLPNIDRYNLVEETILKNQPFFLQ
jgi:hypothetical protein